MSQTSEVSVEPLRWPIAPDGFIPNSVIRSWMMGGKGLAKTDCYHDSFFWGLHLAGYSSDDEEDESTRIFWFIEDEEEEEYKNEDKKVEKKKKRTVETTEEVAKEGKERVGENKEKEEEKMDRAVFVKPSYNIQAKTTLQNQLKTFDDGKMNVEPKDLSSTYNSRKTTDVLTISSYENGPKPQREQKEDMKIPETIRPSLRYLSVPSEQRPLSFISTELPQPPARGPVVSADLLIPKQDSEPGIPLYTKPQKLPPHPLKPPPSIPEDPQPKTDPGLRERSPVREKTNPLSSTKYKNIGDQVQVPLERKVLELHKKFKIGNKKLHHGKGKISTTAEVPPASQGEGRLKPMAEWRKNLLKQGLRARSAAAERPVKPSGQLAANIPTLRPDQAAAHQRVVQNIQMTDTPEPDSFCFHCVIPMASQHGFFTLNPCGKIRYGRLQFAWMRGSEEDKLLRVFAVKMKNTAHKVFGKNNALNRLNQCA